MDGNKVLGNKLGLISSADLAREEERISKKKAVELFESGMLNKLEAGSFSALKAIHKYLFDKIYDFSGKTRKVNISKGNFRFAPLMYLEAALANIDKILVVSFKKVNGTNFAILLSPFSVLILYIIMTFPNK